MNDFLIRNRDCRLNNVFGSKFLKNYQVRRQAPEDDQRVYWLKHWEYNNRIAKYTIMIIPHLKNRKVISEV